MVAALGERAAALAAAPDPDTPFAPPWTTLSVGWIEGGEARNVIPDACQFLWEIRPLPGVDGHAILAEIEAWVAQTLLPEMQAMDPGAGITTELVADCKGLAVPDVSPAADLIARLWTNTPPRVVSFGTDAAYLQAVGIDTVVFGPGSMDQMHQPEEHITRAELQDGLQFLERLADHLAG
jgi:acetylornithine deacetylase